MTQSRAPLAAVDAREILCPRCGQTLAADATGLSCPSRHGTLLEEQDLMRLPPATRVGVDDAFVRTMEGDTPCPRCKKPMRRAEVQPRGMTLGYVVSRTKGGDGRVHLDRCASCRATWFDTGELERSNKMYPEASTESFWQRIKGWVNAFIELFW